MCHQSPAKLLRSIKRITNFLEKKNCQDTNISIIRCQPSLSLYHLPPVDIPPSPPKLLSCTTLPPTSIAPAKNLTNYEVKTLAPIDIPPMKIQKLYILRSGATSIPPRPVYHPAIINASQAFFSKHPSQLTAEEIQKFKQKEDKASIGEPLQTEVIFLPNGGIRTCCNCGELT